MLQKRIDELILNANSDKFNEVEIVIKGKKKKYTSIYNWFDFQTSFQEHPKKQLLGFNCIICKSEGNHNIYSAPLGKPGNLLKHLYTHSLAKYWSDTYKKHKEKDSSINFKKIDTNTISLIKFFIDSNVALDALEDRNLRKILPVRLSKYSFKQTILPQMMQFLYSSLSTYLRQAQFVSLTTDIWTNRAMKDFLAVGAFTVDSSFHKQVYIIGMVPMKGPHNAENIKVGIEAIVNNLDFNKAKITSIVTDEGSNLLRLFKQIEGQELYIPIEENNNEEVENIDEDENVENDEIASNDEDNAESDDEEYSVKVNELDSYEFKNPLEYVSKSASDQPALNITDQSYDSEYNLEKGSLLTDISLKIGSSEIPRFSCAAHKINLVVRKAILSSNYVSNMLTRLSNFAKSIKKSIDLSKRHSEKNSKIHRQQFTRWNSTFFMLYSYLKAYRRKVFNNDYACPIDEKEIEEYLQILLPLYIFTNDIQSDDSNISIIVPSLLEVIYGNLGRMQLQDKNQDELRQYLIHFILKKFEYEMTSAIYLAASVLNVGLLSKWKKRSFSKSYNEKGLNSIYEVLNYFSNEKISEKANKSKYDSELVNQKDLNMNLNGLRLEMGIDINFSYRYIGSIH
jgi:hypothetical protein